jgi:hypothetical protein
MSLSCGTRKCNYYAPQKSGNVHSPPTKIRSVFVSTCKRNGSQRREMELKPIAHTFRGNRRQQVPMLSYSDSRHWRNRLQPHGNSPRPRILQSLVHPSQYSMPSMHATLLCSRRAKITIPSALQTVTEAVVHKKEAAKMLFTVPRHLVHLPLFPLSEVDHEICQSHEVSK